MKNYYTENIHELRDVTVIVIIIIILKIVIVKILKLKQLTLEKWLHRRTISPLNRLCIYEFFSRNITFYIRRNDRQILIISINATI